MQDGHAERIGIMGGTFDPPHLGHLFIAEDARVRCELSRVVFVPNNVPAHATGKRAHAEPEARWQMTLAAIRDNPHFEASRAELDRPGPSFAFDTLRAFGEQFPGAQLFFIVGADSIQDVPTWFRGDELFAMCRFIAVSRPGFDWEAAQNALTIQQRARVEWLETPGLDVSSSEVRARVAQGWPVRYLVPTGVEHEIVARRLYVQ